MSSKGQQTCKGVGNLIIEPHPVGTFQVYHDDDSCSEPHVITDTEAEAREFIAGRNHAGERGEHSPLPWVIAGPSSNLGEAEVIKSKYRTIAWTADSADEDGEYISAEDKANAAFIVRACNVHAKLVEALTEIAEFDEHCRGDAAARIARAALKLAGEGGQQ